VARPCLGRGLRRAHRRIGPQPAQRGLDLTWTRHRLDVPRARQGLGPDLAGFGLGRDLTRRRLGVLRAQRGLGLEPAWSALVPPPRARALHQELSRGPLEARLAGTALLLDRTGERGSLGPSPRLDALGRC